MGSRAQTALALYVRECMRPDDRILVTFFAPEIPFFAQRGFAGGLAYAVAPVVAAPVQAHVAFVWSFAVPLLVRRAVLDARGERPRPVLLAGLLVLAFLCSAYHLVFGGLAYLLVGLLWPGSALRRPAAMGRVALAGLGALVVLSPFVVSRWDFERDERAAGGESP